MSRSGCGSAGACCARAAAPTCSWCWRPRRAGSPRRPKAWAGSGCRRWAVSRFSLSRALFASCAASVSRTKYHHDVLPAVPAIAILIGWFLDALGEGTLARAPAAAALLGFGVPVMALAAWNLCATPQAAQRLLWLFDYDYIYSARGRPSPALDYAPW